MAVFLITNKHSKTKLKANVMNTKLGFLLPRILGLAIIAGMAAFLLALIAKVLIAAAIIGAAAMIVKKAIGHQKRKRSGLDNAQEYRMNKFGNSPFYRQNPMEMNRQHQNYSIIPIN